MSNPEVVEVAKVASLVDDIQLGTRDELIHAESYYLAHHIIFKIDNVLFRAPKDYFMHSDHFKEMFDSEHIGNQTEGQADDNPIDLIGITIQQFSNFLDVMLYRTINFHLRPTEAKLKDALRLATMWGFHGIREYAVSEIDEHFSSPPPDPLDRLELAEECNVPKWRASSFLALCERQSPLAAEEICRLKPKEAAAIARVREKHAVYKAIAYAGTRVYCAGSHTENGNSNWKELVCPHEAIISSYQSLHKQISNDPDLKTSNGNYESSSGSSG